jgi:hypothetical protein
MNCVHCGRSKEGHVGSKLYCVQPMGKRTTWYTEVVPPLPLKPVQVPKAVNR